VVEVDASAQWKQEETQHRALTELALLGAIREEARADEADAALSRAEQARALRDDFLAEVSHEMRTPLQAILTHVRLIELGEYGTVNKEGMEALTAIRGGMRHVVALIGELQQYGSSAERRIEYSIARVNVETAVLTAVSLVAPQAHAKGIGLTITAEAPCPAVAADAAKLLQILLNLLSNAVKFTGAGGSITVSCEPKLGDDALVRAVAIHVADTGRGIASNQIPLVFVPYVQVGAQSSEVDRGVGLGLSISRALAAGMGGDLMARSTPGSGSVFTLTMPSV
jgi:signal transduction histidine kinase